MIAMGYMNKLRTETLARKGKYETNAYALNKFPKWGRRVPSLNLYLILCITRMDYKYNHPLQFQSIFFFRAQVVAPTIQTVHRFHCLIPNFDILCGQQLFASLTYMQPLSFVKTFLQWFFPSRIFNSTFFIFSLVCFRILFSSMYFFYKCCLLRTVLLPLSLSLFLSPSLSLFLFSSLSW